MEYTINIKNNKLSIININININNNKNMSLYTIPLSHLSKKN
mgnify:CR=1 FL=1